MSMKVLSLVFVAASLFLTSQAKAKNTVKPRVVVIDFAENDLTRVYRIPASGEDKRVREAKIRHYARLNQPQFKFPEL